MSTSLTTDQVLRLAPDASAAKAGQGLATRNRWRSLGRSESIVWGECQGSGKDPYRTQADLSEPAFRCSCPSRKFPCKHALGLLLLLAQEESAFACDEAPEWVREWIEARAKRSVQRVRKEVKRSEVADRAAQERRASARESRVEAGLADLRLWLEDLVRGGLASLPTRGYGYWNDPAARLVDAQAPGAARLVREMSGIPASGAGWQQRLLEKIGSLHLLLAGFERIDELPAGTQADMRTLIGWSESQEELLAREGVRDLWSVLGQVTEDYDRLRARRLWLRGARSGRDALLLDFVHSSQSFDVSLAVGTEVEAELVFYPGAWPLRALIKERFSPLDLLTSVPRESSIIEAHTAYRSALALNPWIERFPVALSGVVPARRGEGWIVRDGAGAMMQVARRFAAGWEMVALSGGRAIGLFGEWDGETILPLSLRVEGRFLAFAQ